MKKKILGLPIAFMMIFALLPGTAIAEEADKPVLTIIAVDQKYVYNGEIQGEGDTAYDDSAEIAEKIRVEGLLEGDYLASIILDGQGQEVGKYDLVPSNATVEGEHDASFYDIHYVNGILEITGEKYTIKFLNDDGTELQSSEYAAGEMPEYEGETPTKSATAQYTYTFAGWEPELAEVTEEAIYTATYESIVNEYELTFDLNGGTLDGQTGTITIKCKYGDIVRLPGAPTKEGYKFLYWKGSEYAAGAEYTVEGAHTFTAEWEEVKKEPETKSENIPKTGDNGNTEFWAAIMGGTLLLIILGILAGRRILRK